ncbi:protein of unknown function [Candidatus Methylocalor cossyra]|uniref:Uncharacterized protein n=1 Tax=Candidatus Methylocalor cossyra TaxID=3108543 RepID=A0ABM9NED7_9GAMM
MRVQDAAAQVSEELIALAQEMREASARRGIGAH